MNEQKDQLDGQPLFQENVQELTDQQQLDTVTGGMDNPALLVKNRFEFSLPEPPPLSETTNTPGARAIVYHEEGANARIGQLRLPTGTVWKNVKVGNGRKNHLIRTFPKP